MPKIQSKFLNKIYEQVCINYKKILKEEDEAYKKALEWVDNPAKDEEEDEERTEFDNLNRQHIKHFRSLISLLYRRLYDMGLMKEFCDTYEILLEDCVAWLMREDKNQGV